MTCDPPNRIAAPRRQIMPWSERGPGWCGEGVLGIGVHLTLPSPSISRIHVSCKSITGGVVRTAGRSSPPYSMARHVLLLGTVVVVVVAVAVVGSITTRECHMRAWGFW